MEYVDNVPISVYSSMLQHKFRNTTQNNLMQPIVHQSLQHYQMFHSMIPPFGTLPFLFNAIFQ